MPTLIEAATPPIPPAAPATPVEQPLPPAGETVAPPVETAAPPPAAPVTDAQAEYEAKRQTLLDEIARQDQIVAQLEQMQATFGAATPHAITLALAEARDARAKAQAELDALQPPPPPAHPVAPAAPLPFTAPPVSETAVTVTSPPEALPSAATVLAPPAGPRLVFESGQEIPVPTDKTEITIGREDPISGIHPEIDLTPYGGESGGVSRQHARLINKGGQWSIVDLGSTNYTRVDGLRIEPGAPHPLNDGARLQFGRLTVTFRM
ncbi:MAG: FHA domain-containing protein [Roseiflexaceae bacterium]|nr:FHA domain-containing protein [Roseiflexaceae bacterium]